MEGYLVLNNVYYRVFDKLYKNTTLFYAKHKADNHLRLAEIEQNLDNIKKDLGANNILILRQVHGNTVIDADQINDFREQPEGDGAITTKNKLALAVQTADCVPVLLASADEQIIGAAHCGWRSAKADIISVIINKMRKGGANEIRAFIGPSIKQSSYEVDENFYQDFLKDNRDYAKFFLEPQSLRGGVLTPTRQSSFMAQKNGLPRDLTIARNDEMPIRYMFDLPGFVLSKLRDCGVDDVIVSENDTYSMPEQYPSYRYSTHNNIPYNINILSTIVIC
jgi:polyphenol oxidase